MKKKSKQKIQKEMVEININILRNTVTLKKYLLFKYSSFTMLC